MVVGQNPSTMNTSDFDLGHQNESVESKIVASLERISQAFRVLLWQESKEYSLSPIQIQVLIFLLYHSAEKRKVSYLADEFNMTKATISETVKTLEQKMLIYKVYEVHDTRSYIIHLTEMGKSIAEKTASFTKEIHSPIDKLRNADKVNLLLSLMDVMRHLNKNGIIAIQRMCLTCRYDQISVDRQNHFCTLLHHNNLPSELRIDCPEFEIKR